MIILLGTKSFTLKNGTVRNSECPECKSVTDFRYSVCKRYTHLTFLPIFPVDSVIYTECCHCKKTFDYDELPDAISNNMTQQEKNNRFQAPIWMYAGTFILIGLAAYGGYNYFHSNDLTATYIKNPIAGDVYSMKFSNGYYSTMKIDSITHDSVYSIDNDYNAYMPYETDEIDLPANYSNKFVKFSKKELMAQFDNGTVYLIKRK